MSSVSIVNNGKPQAIITGALPLPGTLDAKRFLIALRKAGDRVEQIRAIAGYVGYNTADSYGTQEYAARSKAQREIKPAVVMAKPEVSSRGYVAGMPDNRSKKLADLMGRERVVSGKIAEQEQHAREAVSKENKDYHCEMAKIERSRLEAIRNDIKGLL